MMKNLTLFSTAETTNKPDGFVVVAVLWILGALATLVSVYAAYMINTAAAFSVYDEDARAQSLASAAVELAARDLTTSLLSRPAHGSFTFRMSRASITVDFRSETSRIDLNAAPKELLQGLFTALGARPEAAESYSRRIVAWRSPTGDQDEEKSMYRRAGLGYGPRGGKFPHVNELSLVMGLPASLVERASSFLTVYSGRPEVNALLAAPEVIAALPGINREKYTAILAQRSALPADDQALVKLLGPAQKYVTTEAGKTSRILIGIDFDTGRRMHFEVVILIFEEGNQPFGILSWKNQFDEMAINERVVRQ